MHIEALDIDDNLILQNQSGQKGLSREILASLVQAEALVVMSNWVDYSGCYGLEPVPFRIGGKIQAVEDILALPHRMTVLANPAQNETATYYLSEVVWADNTANPKTPLEELNKTTRHGLYLLGTRNTEEEKLKHLVKYFNSWKGHYAWVSDRYGFSKAPNQEEIQFKLHLDYPQGLPIIKQISIEINATEWGEKERIIPVMDEECQDLADKIIALNRTISEKPSRLLR